MISAEEFLKLMGNLKIVPDAAVPNTGEDWHVGGWTKKPGSRAAICSQCFCQVYIREQAGSRKLICVECLKILWADDPAAQSFISASGAFEVGAFIKNRSKRN